MPNPTGAGFFGKLPGAGDFVQRRLPARFVDRWDQHFEHAVQSARGMLGNDWQAAYEASPVWRFALPPGIGGDTAWLGVMGPASDRVGRCFPMVIAAPVASSDAVDQGLRQGSHWFDALARVHGEGQADRAMSVEAFDARLTALPGPLQGTPTISAQPPQPLDWRSASHWRFPLAADGAAQVAGLWRQLAAEASWCLWWTTGAARVPPSLLVTRGLPQPQAYAAFLDAAQAVAPWQSAGAFAACIDADVTQNRAVAMVGGGWHAAPPPAPVPAPPRTLLPDDLSDLLADLAPATMPAAVRDDDGAPGPARPELALVAADDGVPDPRRQAAGAVRAVVAEWEAGTAAGDLAALRARLLALHGPLQQRRGDLVDPVDEDGVVVAAQVVDGRASVLRIGGGAAWHCHRGRLRALFAADACDDVPAAMGGDLDDLLFGRVAMAVPGLGAAAQPVCEETACTLAPGDRLLLMATQALVQLPSDVLAEALALPSTGEARGRIAAAAGFRSQPDHWPLAIIEVTP